MVHYIKLSQFFHLLIIECKVSLIQEIEGFLIYLFIFFVDKFSYKS